ncbi:GGDEF domain-containing protein [Methyloraptor flagellatus]|uniref:GGDEF domain-containing protein n=1 Tax=Methyloraptor flagellatus TaxID=3162530 RepID=A0AAU7XF53_9HYPH
MLKLIDAISDNIPYTAKTTLSMRDLQRLSARQIGNSIGAGREVYVAVIAIDDFPSLARRYGPATVDRMLRAATTAIAGALRPHDALAVHGPGAFVAVLSYCDLDSAERVCEDLRYAVTSTSVIATDLTVSIGLADVGEGEPDAVRAIRRGEAALQIAQEHGVNRTVIDDLVFA